jgi:hypothetical protein
MVTLTICDVEASHEKIIDTVCLVACEFHTKKKKIGGVRTRSGKGGIFTDVRQSRVTDMVIIKLSDVITKSSQKDYVDKKHVIDVHTCAKNKKDILFMTYEEMIKFMIQFVHKNGKKLITHNMFGDLESLTKTQEFVGGHLVKDLEKFPTSGINHPLWGEIDLMCSWSILCNRAPVFMNDYKKFCFKNKIHVSKHGNLPTTLDMFIKFVKDDLSYCEKHAASQDTFDLYQVLERLFLLDGEKPFEGKSYMKINLEYPKGPNNIEPMPQSVFNNIEVDSTQEVPLDPFTTKVTFGKYKGHALSVMRKDPRYMEWIKSENLVIKYPYLQCIL